MSDSKDSKAPAASGQGKAQGNQRPAPRPDKEFTLGGFTLRGGLEGYYGSGAPMRTGD